MQNTYTDEDLDRFTTEFDQAQERDRLNVVTPLGKTVGELTAEDLAELAEAHRARARRALAEADQFEAELRRRGYRFVR